MIRISVKTRGGAAECRTKVRCKGTWELVGETASAMAAAIEAACKSVPEMEPEMLAELAVKLYRRGKSDDFGG